MQTSRDADLGSVIRAFIRGWAYCRGGTGTTIRELGDGAYHVHFGAPVGGRTDEFFSLSGNVGQTVDAIRIHHPELEHWLTVFQNREDDVENTLEPSGYALGHREYLMYIPLLRTDWDVRPEPDVRRIVDPEEAQFIYLHFNRSIVAMDRLADPHLRCYSLYRNGVPVGHAACSILDGVVCLDNVFVSPDHRGQGLAAELCTRMLSDASRDGARSGVLVSSEMGHALYRKLGYRDASPVFVFKRQGSSAASTDCSQTPGA